MSDLTMHEAEIIIARSMIWSGTQQQWEDYPDIGELSFERAVRYAELMAPFPERFDEAYDLLASMAEKVTDDE